MLKPNQQLADRVDKSVIRYFKRPEWYSSFINNMGFCSCWYGMF